MQETTVEEVARTADAVVRGRVERQASRWSRDGRRILTDVDVVVDSAWKGAPPRRVRVTVSGGRVGRIAQRVDAAPAFEDGEDVVIFLARRGTGWRVAGLALGKFRVDGGTARPSIEGVTFAPRPRPAGERLVGELPVAELERRVREAR